MKRLFVLALLTFLATIPAVRAAQYAAIVVDAKTGEVLHAVEPDTQSYPASLTKMMTLYLVFEAIDSGRLKLGDLMPVSAYAAQQSPTKLGAPEGSYLSVADAIGALVTKSANDAATVVAEYLANGSEDAFARKMTAKARRLGMSNSTFRNASGLPDPEQLSTVRDMATLSRALLRDFPHHYHYFSMTAFEYGGHTIRNHNRLLYHGKGYDGIKTGYTHGSGFNLAASAERDGRRMIGVVFGGQSGAWRDSRMARLVDMAYAGSAAPTTMVASKKSKTPAATQVADAAPAKPKKSKNTQVAEKKPVLTLVSQAQAGTLDQPAAKAAAKRVQNQAIGYAVQVGAFSRQEMAQAAAVKAKSAEPGLAEAKVSVQHQGKGKDAVYVARLTGMSQQAAKSSCGALKKKAIDCIVVGHDPA